MIELSPLAAFDGFQPSHNGLVVHERRNLAIATIMARNGQRAALAASVKEQFDIDLRGGPFCAHSDALSLLGTGPGRWLMIHDAPLPHYVRDLAQKLEGLASVVDQSGAYGVLRLSGPAVLDVLAKGVAIDLAATAFAAGRVAVTQVAHIGVTLWKIDEAPTIDLAVARSMAGSLRHWLDRSVGARAD